MIRGSSSKPVRRTIGGALPSSEGEGREERVPTTSPPVPQTQSTRADDATIPLRRTYARAPGLRVFIGVLTHLFVPLELFAPDHIICHAWLLLLLVLIRRFALDLQEGFRLRPILLSSGELFALIQFRSYLLFAVTLPTVVRSIG